jgi:vanillate O-demethylase ferredoxin subunit
MAHCRLVVADIRAETPLIRRLVLADPTGAPLPAFKAGAHITVVVPAIGRRKYSLVVFGGEPDPPTRYVLGVRLEADGGGGSKYLHSLNVGDPVEVEPPENKFPLREGPEPVVLLAGGIGMTPMISMAATLGAAGRPYRIIYAARTASEYAFLPEIRAIAGARLSLHADDTDGGVLDIPGLFAGLEPGTRVYACGPMPMLKAAMGAAKRLGWPRDRLAYELFYSVAD